MKASGKSRAARKPGPAWKGRSVRSLRLSDLMALIRGEIAFLCVPRYLSPDLCADIVRRFLAGPHEKHAYGRDKTRQLGAAVAVMVLEREAYFARAPKIMAALRELYRGGEDPMLKLRRDMDACTGWKYVPAVENGRPYASDMIGALEPGSGVVLHADSPSLQPDLFIAKFPVKLSWNVYLSNSERGGALTLYRKLFAEKDLPLHHGYEGYEAVVVDGIPKAVYAPSPGDLVLFNPCHFHEVEVTGGGGWRSSAHAWIAVDPEGKRMTYWS